MTSAYDPAFAARALAAGRLGKSRAEIAVELGFGLAAMRAMEAAHPDFAAALDLADAAARAWWDALPREAVMKGGQFHPAAWAKAVALRFGSASYRPRTQDRAAAKKVPEAIVRLPDNGTRRKPPGSRSGR